MDRLDGDAYNIVNICFVVCDCGVVGLEFGFRYYIHEFEFRIGWNHEHLEKKYKCSVLIKLSLFIQK